MSICDIPYGTDPVDVGPIFGVDYLWAYHCTFQNYQFLFVILLCSLIVGLLWTLGNTANNYLSPTLSKVCEKLNLSYNVAGVTFLAFGNGAPDVFTQVAALSSLNSDSVLLGLNTVLGSSMFVVTIVVGTVAILSPCHVSSKIFLRDVSFHIAAVTTVAIIGISHSLSLLIGIFLLIVYVSYVVVVLVIAERDAKLASSTDKILAPKRIGDAFPVLNSGIVVRPLGSDLQTAYWFKIDKTDANSTSNTSVTAQQTAQAVVGKSSSSGPVSSNAAKTKGGYTFLVLDEDDSESDGEEVSFPKANKEGGAAVDSAGGTKKLKTAPALDDGTIMLSGGLLNSTFEGEIIEDYVDIKLAARRKEEQELGIRYDVYSGAQSLDAESIRVNKSHAKIAYERSPLTQGLLSASDTGSSSVAVERFLDDSTAPLMAGEDSHIQNNLQDVEMSSTQSDLETASVEVRAINRVHGIQLQGATDTVTEALYWENRFLQNRIRKLQASDFWTLPFYLKFATALEFPVNLLRDTSIPTLQLESWYRPYAVAHPIVIGFVCEWTFRDWNTRTVLTTLLIGAVPAIAIHLNTHTSKPPTHPAVVLLWVLTAFFMCIVWMYLLCGELISCLQTFGSIMNIPSAYLGLTILAWGNCIGDFFSISSIARRGLGEMALAGCYGSPVFDILFGLGVSIISSTAQLYPQTLAIQLDPSSWVSIAFLYLTLALTLVIVGHRGWRVEKGFGYLLYAIYAAYTLVQILLLIS